MSCVVPGCKSHAGELKCFKGEMSFHRFPVDEQLKKKWINNIGRPNWQPTLYSRICSLHFEPGCYRNVSPQMPARKCLHSYAVPTIFPNRPAYSHQIEGEPLPENSKERLQEKNDKTYLTNSSLSVGGDSVNLADATLEIEIKEEPLPDICHDPLHLPVIEDVDVKEEVKDKPLDISNEWPRGEIRTVSSSMDIGESIDIPSDNNKLRAYLIKLNTSNNAAVANAKNYDNQTPSSCDCAFNKALLEGKYESKIFTLKKQVEKQRTTSEKRLKKLKALRKAMSRLVEKNKNLFELLVERTQQNEGSKYLANADDLNGNVGNEDDDGNLNESDDDD